MSNKRKLNIIKKFVVDNKLKDIHVKFLWQLIKGYYEYDPILEDIEKSHKENLNKIFIIQEYKINKMIHELNLNFFMGNLIKIFFSCYETCSDEKLDELRRTSNTLLEYEVLGEKVNRWGDYDINNIFNSDYKFTLIGDVVEKHFLGGSIKWGYPHDDSDIDVFCYIKQENISLLIDIIDKYDSVNILEYDKDKRHYNDSALYWDYIIQVELLDGVSFDFFIYTNEANYERINAVSNYMIDSGKRYTRDVIIDKIKYYPNYEFFKSLKAELKCDHTNKLIKAEISSILFKGLS